MSVIDCLLLAAILLVAGWWVFASGRARSLLRLAPVGLVALAILQLIVEGFYWQLAPAYLFILVVASLAILRGKHAHDTGGAVKVAGSLALVALALIAIAPWMLFLPVPTLTRPDGPYAVGSQTFRWIDASRPEDATDDPADRRNVIVQAWYPAAAGATGKTSVYIDGVGRLPPQISLLPSFLMRHYDRIDTHARDNAALSADKARWPVVIFLTGYGGPRAFYTSVISGLASRGYVVLAVDHPYEAAVTQLADGKVAATVEKFAAGDPTRTRFMEGRLNLRIADVAFALDQLNRPNVLGPVLANHLDLDHIAAIGHSLGGASAAAAMDRDPRIKAAANIDGTLYGGVSGTPDARPFLLLESDHAESGHSDSYEAGNQAFFARFTGGDYRYQISHANHFSFTDALLFFAPPGRFAASLLIGGGRGPAETHRATVDIVDAFLQGPLTGQAGDVEAAAKRYRGIAGGPVPAGLSPAPR